MFAPKSPLEEDFWQASSAPEARKRLVEALHYELLGPSATEEELFESPVTRYLTGLPAPFGTDVLPSEQDVSLALGDGDEDTGETESTPPMSQPMTPSSIGISFLVSENVDAVIGLAGLEAQKGRQPISPRSPQPSSRSKGIADPGQRNRGGRKISRHRGLPERLALLRSLRGAFDHGHASEPAGSGASRE